METLRDIATLDLMEHQINTLFCCDPDGRLRHVNELDAPLAPRFFMGRTRHGNFWRFRYDLPADTIDKLENLCKSEPLTADLANPPRNYAAIKAVIHDHAPLTREYRGPAYWISEDTQTSANVVLISESSADLLRAGFPWMLPLPQGREVGPVAAVIEHGSAVSLCFCARLPIQATEAGVETLAAFRGKGYATAAVAKWAAEVRQQGYIPLYSTSWDNLASQSIARKLRMVLYGEDWWIQ